MCASFLDLFATDAIATTAREGPDTKRVHLHRGRQVIEQAGGRFVQVRVGSNASSAMYDPPICWLHRPTAVGTGGSDRR